MTTGNELLVVEDLKKHFPITRGIIFQKEIATVKAVDGVSFTLREGETLGIVGESGCGKSTLVRCILKLLEPSSGRILYEGRDITGLSRRDMRPLRRNMMMVFQDPYASLNARKRVGFIIGEALELHGIGTPSERKRRVQELLEVVGLNPEHYNRFPHEFSGGQRQRIGVARALAVNPKLILCDEPVSALDVSVQAQILNLLKDLQREFGLTYVFIAHDLNVVRHISDRVMVMYLGKAVELANRDELYVNPKHPYTGALLSAVPLPNPETGRARKRVVLEGDVPNPINPPAACNFHPRCPRFHEGHCDVETPPLERDRGGAPGRLSLPARTVADGDRAAARDRGAAGRVGRVAAARLVGHPPTASRSRPAPRSAPGQRDRRNRRGFGGDRRGIRQRRGALRGHGSLPRRLPPDRARRVRGPARPAPTPGRRRGATAARRDVRHRDLHDRNPDGEPRRAGGRPCDDLALPRAWHGDDHGRGGRRPADFTPLARRSSARREPELTLVELPRLTMHVERVRPVL